MAQKRVVVRKKVRKKMPTGHALRPASRKEPSRDYYQEPDPVVADEEFGLADFAPYILVLACLGLIIFLFLPVNLSQVDGFPYREKDAVVRNLLQEAEKKVLEGAQTIEFTEKEINTYLHQRLRSPQEGPFAAINRVDGIYADLRENAATLYVVQKILGIPFVISSSWNFYLEDRTYVRECTASSIGRIRFTGASLGPLMMPFLHFAESCKPEASFLDIDGIHRVRIEPGVFKLELARRK